MGIMLNGGNKNRVREEVLHLIGIGKMISIGVCLGVGTLV